MWAVRHTYSLKADVTKGAADGSGQGLISTTTEYQPNRHCFVATVSEIGPTATLWALKFGDVVQNLRASLDHVAWAVYQRGTKVGAADEGQVMYPFAATYADWSGLHPKRFPGARRADLTIVRRYQPYRVGKSLRRSYALTYLGRLSNDDKHRTLHLPVALPTGPTYYKVREVCGCTVTRIAPATGFVPIEIGTELLRVYVRKDGSGLKPHLEVYGQTPCVITVDKQVLVDAWCVQATQVVRQLLTEFAQPPEGVTKLLASI